MASFRNLSTSCKIVDAVTYTGAGTTQTNSSQIDMAGYRGIMAIGKFGRYVVMTSALLGIF